MGAFSKEGRQRLKLLNFPLQAKSAKVGLLRIYRYG